jgi:hypothetical protein
VVDADFVADLFPVLDDGVGGVDEGAVAVEEEAVEVVDFWGRGEVEVGVRMSGHVVGWWVSRMFLVFPLCGGFFFFFSSACSVVLRHLLNLVREKGRRDTYALSWQLEMFEKVEAVSMDWW